MDQRVTRDPTTNLDPFGIFDACLRVQQAWLSAPNDLQQRLGMWWQGQSALQAYCHQRLFGAGPNDPVVAQPADERFQDAAWSNNFYFDWMKEQYLFNTRWVEDAIEATPQIDDSTRRKALFWTRQAFNAWSPSNCFFTNPEAVRRAFSTNGMSLTQSWRNFLQDAGQQDIRMVDTTKFEVGRNIATTPGHVVFRNELLEVIQYKPTTGEVREIPIVIVSPWINKYYILDLNPAKSLVRYLVDQGFKVFITSWKNPDSSQRNTTLDDYMLKGVLQTIEVARAISGTEQVHAVGYCIGGTVLSALMAWLNKGSAKKEVLPVAHWTLFTALTDFTDPGEIGVFIDEESVRYLENKMAGPGYLDGGDMSWSFRMLRSNSLIWHYVVHGYMYGEEPPQFDVLFWNTDSTRLPAAMHSFYLRELYMNNRLAQPNALQLGGRPINLGLIQQPLYAVGTEQDHIAPWKETFKICQFVKGPVRYALATSGHILGIVNPPVNPPKRHYWVGEASGQSQAESWRAGLERKPGSWWDDWSQWLHTQCGDLQPAPVTAGNKTYPALVAAPGTYVLEK